MCSSVANEGKGEGAHNSLTMCQVTLPFLIHLAPQRQSCSSRVSLQQGNPIDAEELPVHQTAVERVRSRAHRGGPSVKLHQSSA